MRHTMLRGKKTGSGFTLIELLIVIAIIAILALIAVPNFLEAQTRAKVSRFMADLRSSATALEQYMMDNGMYPPADYAPVGSNLPHNAIPDEPAEGFLPRSLTTPIAYMTSLPNDVFPNRQAVAAGHPADHPPHYSNDQFNQRWYGGVDQFFVARLRAGVKLGRVPAPGEFDRSALWVSQSHGPDGDHDDFESAQGYPTEYDPTNGTVSDGDIFFFGPGIGFSAR